MINFTVGPVQMEEEIREIGAEEIPYFRTPDDYHGGVLESGDYIIKAGGVQ